MAEENSFLDINGLRHFKERFSEELDISIPLPVSSGGTGATDKRSASVNVGALVNTETNAANVTGGVDNDTQDFWMTQPSGDYYFSQNNMINGQPGQWGFLHHTVRGNVISQFWLFGSNVWTRSSSTSGAMPNFTSSKLVRWQEIYPVGAVYISYVSTSPASLFGGSWEQITGYFLRAANDTNTGGEDTVTLTSAQSGLRAHSHSVTFRNGTASGSKVALQDPIACSATKTAGDYTVSNTASAATSSHSNTPQYQDLYVWRRTG